MILSSGQAIVVQVEVFSILLVTAGIFVFLFMVNSAITKSDPLAKPKGLVLIGMLYYEFIQGLTNDNMGKKTAVKYGVVPTFSGFTSPFVFGLVTVGMLFILKFAVDDHVPTYP